MPRAEPPGAWCRKGSVSAALWSSSWSWPKLLLRTMVGAVWRVVVGGCLGWVGWLVEERRVMMWQGGEERRAAILLLPTGKRPLGKGTLCVQGHPTPPNTRHQRGTRPGDRVAGAPGGVAMPFVSPFARSFIDPGGARTCTFDLRSQRVRSSCAWAKGVGRVFGFCVGLFFFCRCLLFMMVTHSYIECRHRFLPLLLPPLSPSLPPPPYPPNSPYPS